MSIKLIETAWDVTGLTITHKLILMSLSDNANNSGACWPSVDYIARRCDCDRSTVFRALDVLEKAGHIRREPRARRSTVYWVHPQVQSQDATQGVSNLRPTPVADCDPPPSQIATQNRNSEPSEEEPSENRAAKRGSRKVPEGWEPLPGLLQEIRCDPKCAGIDIERELAKMRNHEFKQPRKDWPKVFYNWCLTAGGSKQAPAKVDAAGKPIIHRFYYTDPTSGNVEIAKIPEADLKPWELEKLRDLQKRFKKSTFFYLHEIGREPS